MSTNAEQPIDPIGVLDRLSVFISRLHKYQKYSSPRRRWRYEKIAQDQIRLLQDLWRQNLEE
ncbi:MAG: hypothetical protein AAF518_01595 [Spirochaetota bacterium]